MIFGNKIKEPGWWIFIIAIIIFIAIVCSNPLVHPQWNKGKCPQDNVYYDLKEINGKRSTYICPECHYELTIRK